MLDEEAKEHIAMEISRQIHPVGVQMDLVLQSNEAQSQQLKLITNWMHEFYGNGSGKTGIFERRIKHDDDRFEELLGKFGELEEERMRKKVRAEIMEEIAQQADGEGKRTREWWMIWAPGATVVGIELAKAIVTYGPRLLHLLGI